MTAEQIYGVNGTRGNLSLFANDLNISSGPYEFEQLNNWWALSAIGLAVGTAAGNILVCLAICWERRLQNMTNYFLMSLAITDLMVAILVMPLGILTLFRGYFPLPSVYCLAWICLDVLFCTASIMHLCTISVDRYLSLRYPMKFGRNKSRRRVVLKIVFVWLLSIAMSLPLSLMYSKNQASLIIEGTCQIPDPLYKLIGSIICFYIPLLVMLVTYALTVRLLANQEQKLGTANWSSNWMGPTVPPLERRYTWKKLLMTNSKSNKSSTSQYGHSAGSTDTEMTMLDTNELWIQESEPTPCTMSALGQFGAEMLKLSRTLQENAIAQDKTKNDLLEGNYVKSISGNSLANSRSSLLVESSSSSSSWKTKRRRASTFHEGDGRDESPAPKWRRRRGYSFHEISATITEDSRVGADENALPLPLPCTCPYFGNAEKRDDDRKMALSVAKPTSPAALLSPGKSSNDTSPSNVVVTWESNKSHRRGTSFGNTRNTLLSVSPSSTTQRTPLLRRSATLRHNGQDATLTDRNKNPSSPCLLQRYNFTTGTGNITRSIRSHHSRNSSILSRNSSRHGRIIKLEQKATKVLGVVFFTFVILWAPFFILNLLPAFCLECEKNLGAWVMHLVTWLGYGSSMVNPIFYTIFNKVFRNAFKKVLTCRYRKTAWRPQR
ncbi:D(2) dopamine receptor [Cylas formicarius]|uniref:D(2) dopamine receptor n=1 Tax=Cylas formicarius TaxID=197179 RepID=UPI0029586302|nr:D(2) dopamine receptor [Cylas formicarius]